MKLIFSITLLFISANVFSQTNTVPYSRDYEFNEGIYLTIDQFKQNSPILKSAIVSPISKDQRDFLTEVLEQKNFTYKDAAGTEQKVETKTVWGYCQNRTIFLNFNNDFNRVIVIGSLFHFTATIRISMPGIDPIMGINNSYDETRQFILNTETNKVLDFNVKNMESILATDPELYQQFMALKKRKKPDLIFVYLRKYNEKHPLYLPVK
jgi:hypothetical protein